MPSDRRPYPSPHTIIVRYCLHARRNDRAVHWTSPTYRLTPPTRSPRPGAGASRAPWDFYLLLRCKRGAATHATHTPLAVEQYGSSVSIHRDHAQRSIRPVWIAQPISRTAIDAGSTPLSPTQFMERTSYCLLRRQNRDGSCDQQAWCCN